VRCVVLSFYYISVLQTVVLLHISTTYQSPYVPVVEEVERELGEGDANVAAMVERHEMRRSRGDDEVCAYVKLAPVQEERAHYVLLYDEPDI